jgi:inhibitor of cysteine peptidase
VKSILQSALLTLSSSDLWIATTVGNSWQFDVKSENDVYTLDEDLEQQVVVTGMGLNERIYSARYIEKKACVVTFRRA